MVVVVENYQIDYWRRKMRLLQLTVKQLKSHQNLKLLEKYFGFHHQIQYYPWCESLVSEQT